MDHDCRYANKVHDVEQSLKTEGLWYKTEVLNDIDECIATMLM